MGKFRVFLEDTGACNGQLLYWVSSKNLRDWISPASLKRMQFGNELPAGFKIPAWTPNPKYMDVEQIFEAVRQQHYPDKVSRINPPCMFLARDEDTAKHWVHDLEHMHGRSLNIDTPIYKVCLNGNYTEADGGILTAITMHMSFGGNKADDPKYNQTLHELAHRYWQGKGVRSEQMQLPEILANGDAHVIGRSSDNDIMPYKVGDTVYDAEEEEENRQPLYVNGVNRQYDTNNSAVYVKRMQQLQPGGLRVYTGRVGRFRKYPAGQTPVVPEFDPNQEY